MKFIKKRANLENFYQIKINLENSNEKIPDKHILYGICKPIAASYFYNLLLKSKYILIVIKD